MRLKTCGVFTVPPGVTSKTIPQPIPPLIAQAGMLLAPPAPHQPSLPSQGCSPPNVVIP